MHWTEIVTIILVSLYALAMLIYYFRKIKNGESLDECSCASNAKKKRKKGQKEMNPLVAEYYAKYKKADSTGSKGNSLGK